MNFTQDELVIIIEALREYRLRVSDLSPRKVVLDALVFRCGEELYAKEAKDPKWI